MSINWDKLQSSLDELIRESAGRTDAKLASQISGVTRLTEDEVKRLFPDPADLKRLANLMEIVKSKSDRNSKVNNIVAGIDDFGGVILTLLTKLG